MEITLVRHGRSLSNSQNVISGAGIDSPLAPEGVAHAQKVSDTFDESKFDIAFVSPLRRAVQTAEILTKGNLKIIPDQRIEEIHFGAWEAQDPEPLRKQFPAAFDYMGNLNENYSDFAPDSESYSDLVGRVADFVNSIKLDYADKNVLIVCHALTIRGFFSAIFHEEMYSFVNVDNVTINEIHLDQDNGFRPRIYSYNKELVLPD